MKKIQKEDNPIKEENLNEIKNSELKGLLIKEIDNLSTNFKKISTDLKLLSDYFDVTSNDPKIKEISPENLQEAINSIKKLTDLGHLGSFPFIINSNKDLNLLGKKSKIHEEERNVPKCKIYKYKDNNGNCIGYYIESTYYDNKVKLGFWKNIEFVKNLRNIFNNKLNELKLEENHRSALIKTFYEKFKNKVYIKYPPFQII